MANLIYNNFKTQIANGTIDLDTDNIKIMLVTSAYTPALGNATRADVTNEVVGTGYVAGGASLAGKTVALVGNEGVFDATDETWANSDITARGAVLYKSNGGVASADPLVMYLDFGADFTSVASDFTVQFNASGILGLDAV